MTGQDTGSQGGTPPDGAQSANLQSASLRCALAADLFAQIAEDMDARPATDEAALAFARRLLGSPTPEEAITFTARTFMTMAHNLV